MEVYACRSGDDCVLQGRLGRVTESFEHSFTGMLANPAALLQSNRISKSPVWLCCGG